LPCSDNLAPLFTISANSSTPLSVPSSSNVAPPSLEPS
jgi:hypothetical protein